MPSNVDTLGRDVTKVIGDSNKWPKVKLTGSQTKLWDETRSATLYVVPSFADIWYAMMVDRDGQTAWFTDNEMVEYAATDDKIMYLNPATFFDWPLQERVFVCVHEVAHAMFNHCGFMHNLRKLGEIRYSDGVTLPVSPDLMNMAADYIIDDMLVSAKVGALPTITPQMKKKHPQMKGNVGDVMCLYDPKLITGDMNLLDAYRKLFLQMGGTIGKDGKGKPPPGSKVIYGNGLARTGFDAHLAPGKGRGKNPSEAQSERNEQAWDNAIAAAMASAKLRGTLPENLERKFLAKMQPQASWEEVYGLAVTRKVGNAAYSWELLNPELMQRNIGCPGRVAFGCDLVIVAIDSSGSTFQSTVDIFIVETRGILETIRPKRVIITQCDTRISEWTEIDPGAYDEMSVKVKGGGGTDFCPVFERVAKEYEEPDVLIYLTDLEGLFPLHAPNYPVVWGSVDKDVKGPFGDTVYIPQQFSKEQ
jgi:predicted metal-dependent peptidase